MTQQYTPVTWQDETTSQQGTLINAERLNQMQTAHHYADGFEEVDAVPTADPGVAYHKVVYCTADSTIYRWDGTEWTKDIDDETKALLQQEIARATEAEGELAQDLADETTARETADTAMQADISALQSGKLDKKTTAPNQTQAYAVRGSAQRMITVGYGPESIPIYGMEETLLAKMPTLYDPTADTVVNYGWATAQIGAEATARAEADTALGGRIDTEQARAEAAEQANAQAIANTYTKAETDTLLATKADIATTYSKTETDTLLALKADQATTYTKAETDTLLGAKANDDAVVHLEGAETIPGAKTFSNVINAENFIRSKHKVLNSYSISVSLGRWVPIYTITKSGQSVPQASFYIALRKNGYAIIQIIDPPSGSLTIQGMVVGSARAPENLFRVSAEDSTTWTLWVYLATDDGIRADCLGAYGSNTQLNGSNITPLSVTTGYTITSEGYTDENGTVHTFTAYAEMKGIMVGTNHVTVPSRAYSAGNTDDVATIATLDAYTPMVRTSGAQPIGGEKTFLNTLYIGSPTGVTPRIDAYGETGSGNRKINIIGVGDTFASPPANYRQYSFISWSDETNRLVAGFRAIHNADGTYTIQAMVLNSNGAEKYITILKGDVIA